MRHTMSLRKNHEFKRAYHRGRSVAGPLMAVYLVRNRRGVNRLGLTVSTKVGGAVVRNRVRRRLRELFRAREAMLYPGHDIVIVARVRAAQAPFSALGREMDTLFRKLSVFAPPAAAERGNGGVPEVSS